MDPLKELACALNKRDEVPNIRLAEKIVRNNDKKAVEIIVSNLTNKNRNIQADCIKVVYETGYRKPELIAPYLNDLLAQLNSSNNRMVWGAMSALKAITETEPEKIYKHLTKLLDTAEKGSVITRDNLVDILVKLESNKKYKGGIFPLLIEQIQFCPENQLPMYAEKTLTVVNEKNKNEYLSALNNRLPAMEIPTKIKRVEKIIKQLSVS